MIGNLRRAAGKVVATAGPAGIETSGKAGRAVIEIGGGGAMTSAFQRAASNGESSFVSQAIDAKKRATSAAQRQAGKGAVAYAEGPIGGMGAMADALRRANVPGNVPRGPRAHGGSSEPLRMGEAGILTPAERMPSLGGPQQVSPRGIAAVSPGGPLAMNEKGIYSETARSTQQVFSTPAIYGPQVRSPKRPSEVYGKFASGFNKAAGMGVSALTSKYAAVGAAGLAATGIAGITGYAGASVLHNQVSMHAQVAKNFNKMRNSLAFGGGNRPQDFEYNPMMTFSRPRVRGGHLGASGGLTLAMNNNRTRR